MLYDDNGHLEQDTRDNGGVFVISHNTHQRNIGILANGVAMANYQHNALGQRIVKTTTNNSVIYHYDEAGQLIGESDQAGNVLEYVYVDTMRIARYDGQTAYYYHNDHLNRPIAITDSGKAIVWQADYTPFGLRTLVNSTADNDLGFPGQILDEESSFYYNYFRYYDPSTGRYTQSDPIGLRGGINTYAYVGNNPLIYIDPYGLAKLPDSPAGLGGGWSQDDGHRNPNGEKWDHESGTSVEWHPGQDGKPGWGGKDHWHVDGGKKHLPPGTDVPDFPSEDDPEACPDDSSCRNVATSVVVGGVAYIVYRCVRMIPSLFPPLWPTIPANAIAP